jgi:oligopeptide transport system permease protein
LGKAVRATARFLVGRLFSAVLTIWVVATITFFLMHSIPGGPFQRDKQLPEEVVRALEAKYHLDDPLWRQYVDYMRGLLRWDLGPSFQKVGVSVNEIIAQSFPVSMKLGLWAMAGVLFLGLPFGVLSALRNGRPEDHLIRLLATLGQTIPSFVLATALIYLFCGLYNLLPSYGLRSWRHYILPVIALGGYSLSFVTRLTRSSLLEVLQQDYIRTARSKGASEFAVVFRHALRNALVPVVTYVGPLIAGILTGSFVVEKIFAIPGLGKFFVDSITNRDYTVLMGVTVLDAVLLCIAILAVDLLYGVIDPRIRVDR